MASARAEPVPGGQGAEMSSEELRATLAALDAGRAANAEMLAALEAGRNAVLLMDDDAKAEAHDAEMRQVQRQIERADLRRPGLVEAIASAAERERAEARAKQQVEARLAVDEIVARLPKEYEKPAGIIATFLADWRSIEQMAAAAGVPGPEMRTRWREPQLIRPERTEVLIHYIDAQGNETSNQYPGGSFELLPNGERDVPSDLRHTPVKREQHYPAEYDSGQKAVSLSEFTSLPEPRIGEAAFWEGSDVYYKPFLGTKLA